MLFIFIFIHSICQTKFITNQKNAFEDISNIKDRKGQPNNSGINHNRKWHLVLFFFSLIPYQLFPDDLYYFIGEPSDEHHAAGFCHHCHRRIQSMVCSYSERWWKVSHWRFFFNDSKYFYLILGWWQELNFQLCCFHIALWSTCSDKDKPIRSYLILIYLRAQAHILQRLQDGLSWAAYKNHMCFSLKPTFSPTLKSFSSIPILRFFSFPLFP